LGMPQARAESLDVDTTAYYHCISRCVRRAFLCGKDPYTGRDFDYRKEWVEERLLSLSEIYAIDVYAYAVMSNHLHVVVKVDRSRADGWSDNEVTKRYSKLFRGARASLKDLPEATKSKRIAVWRERLWSLSWMMRSLNEWIARRANREDECTGRFWEGRFRCQPLLDERALMTCMAYVDLNPLRAGLCKSVAKSAHTSAKRRLEEVRPAGLARFEDEVRKRDRGRAIPLSRENYFALLDSTARGMRGQRLRELAETLEELGIELKGWLGAMTPYGLHSACVLGSAASVEEFAESRDKRWVRGKGAAEQLFGE
ncbi:MAG: transposase, partial [Myxococcota bacterium]